MNVWTALPRLLASSRCSRNVRFLVEESLSSSIRHFSTNTPVSTKTPEDSDLNFSQLVEKALAQADSKVHKKHTPPRLKHTSDSLTFSLSTKARPPKPKRRKMPKAKGGKKAVSRNGTDSTKSEKKKSRESTAKRIPKPIPKQELQDASEHTPPPSQDLKTTLSESSFPTEKWVTEPWANKQNDQRPADDIDRSFPPHILEQKIILEGTIDPSGAKALIDVPTVMEHLPVATLCHGLDRVLFKYVYLLLDFLTIDKSAAPVSIGYETRVRGCTTSLHG
jgi:hypothetical protein